MDFDRVDIIRKYTNWLKLEKGLSENSKDAYMHDLNLLLDYLGGHDLNPLDVKLENLIDFVIELGELELSATSQGRVISGVKSFYRFLLFTDKIETDPTLMLETPKVARKLPEVLTLDEIERMEDAIDLSKDEGQRNLAIIEVLYGSGLRVSELINLKLSNVHVDEKYMLVEGKGSKQRLVPLSDEAISQINFWMQDRCHLNIKPGNEDYLFLNRRGAKLTRVMILYIVKDLAERAGIKKNISPHTFRHSFATHLLEGGANLRLIQMMLGHENLVTTEIYTHLDLNYLREEVIAHHPRNNKKGGMS
ncbi:MAG: tyrosine recombinase XerD [Paludibacteraceae bacterium]|nr:tyrosine recombinase XerD [Paludibacteraceae bacterium]